MFCIVLNSECWIKTEDVQGLEGIPVRVRTPRGCVGACEKKSGCVAADHSFHDLENPCRLLMSTETEPATSKGITHYERIPGCKDEARN